MKDIFVGIIITLLCTIVVIYLSYIINDNEGAFRWGMVLTFLIVVCTRIILKKIDNH